jgi:hypothetical protein
MSNDKDFDADYEIVYPIKEALGHLIGEERMEAYQQALARLTISDSNVLWDEVEKRHKLGFKKFFACTSVKDGKLVLSISPKGDPEADSEEWHQFDIQELINEELNAGYLKPDELNKVKEILSALLKKVEESIDEEH